MGPPPDILDRASKHFAEEEQRERARIDQFGQIRPIIALENWGKRFVVVRNQIHWGNWRFFPDFLQEFGPSIFGREWYETERARDHGSPHPLFAWQVRAKAFMDKQTPEPDGKFAAVPNGPFAACMSLYYDLYVVADNNRLDDVLIARLRHRDQFQGARHELFAEATCLRAGFTIEHENEQDGTQRHVEFIATHRATGQRISVEAKSKHRPGVLGMNGVIEAPEGANLRFVSLINDAITKQTVNPLAIFVDTNLPLRRAEQFFGPQSLKPFVPSRPMVKLLQRLQQERDPYNLIVFTNHPHHYGSDDEIDPRKHLLSMFSQRPKVPATGNALWEIHYAAQLYGNIPNAFPQPR